ncbi:MAG: Ni/Fe hydrogenase subunit alpha [Candidatus Hydrothermarchaeales archaeon]
MKQITIQPVSRIEGHAKVTIQLDDSGNVSDTQVNVVEMRGFEKFCVGRPVEDLPRITPRICGVCPWAHHLASSKACDAVFGVDPPSAAKKIRELALLNHYIESHIAHFYFLSGPDFVIGPKADYKDRNVFGIVRANPDLAKTVVRMRFMAQTNCQLIGARAIHPVVSVPGGWSKPIASDELLSLKNNSAELLDFAKFSLQNAVDNIFPKYMDIVKSMAVFDTSFLGTVDDDGALNFYDGKLRMMKKDGSYKEFDGKDYMDHISEKVMPWTYVKFPYDKDDGDLVMDTDNPVGVFRVNSLARINVCDKITTPLANDALKVFRDSFGRPVQLTLLYHWARLIEMLYAAEKSIELLNDPEITSTDLRVKCEPRAARGVGVIEAARGTLFHDYETDDNGIVTNVNLIVATTNNNAAINMSAGMAAKALIKDGQYDQGILNMVEMAIRAHDPCFSCATHRLDGRIAVRLDIVDSTGNLIDTLTN